MFIILWTFYAVKQQWISKKQTQVTNTPIRSSLNLKQHWVKNNHSVLRLLHLKLAAAVQQLHIVDGEDFPRADSRGCSPLLSISPSSYSHTRELLYWIHAVNCIINCYLDSFLDLQVFPCCLSVCLWSRFHWYMWPVVLRLFAFIRLHECHQLILA